MKKSPSRKYHFCKVEMDNISSDLKEKQNTRIAGSKANPLRFSLSGIIKRVFDFTAALIGLILLSPFFVLISIFIKRDSPGPVFYWGPRIGRDGMVFKMLKFRTMYETPKSYSGPRVTAKDDDRITRFGKWLRDTKLNELPQLWNVLIGEMSLVGPRPEDPSISKTWPRQLRRNCFPCARELQVQLPFCIEMKKICSMQGKSCRNTCTS